MSYANARLDSVGRIVLSTHVGSFRLNRGEALSLIAELSDCLTGGFGERSQVVLRSMLSGFGDGVAQVAEQEINDRADWTFGHDPEWWLK